MLMYFTQYLLSCLYVLRILSESSGCIASYLHVYMGIRLPQGITLSINMLQTRGYEIVSYHWIRVPRSNLPCYLLLCSILRPNLDLEIILNLLNGIYLLVLKKKEKRRTLTLVQI